MKRITFQLMVVSSLLLALVALLAPRAMADDETDKTKIEVQAPLDAVDCAATPPTISVLGLTIDISAAGININDNDDEDDDVSHHSEDPDATCADLIPGQVVEVKLASDILDPTTGLLSAVEVDIGGGDCEDEVCDSVKVEAPLQAIDTAASTVTVLGLVIDISQASLESDDDEDEYEDSHDLARHSYGDDDDDCDEVPLDISQLIVGQFVEMKLASAQPPLVATKLEVKNFDNEVEVEIEDGDDVDDDDVEIDVAVTALVKAHNKAVKKVLRFHTVGNGSVKLNGLPTGKAKIVATRIRDGRKSVGKSSFKVVKGAKQVRLRLKPVR